MITKKMLLMLDKGVVEGLATSFRIASDSTRIEAEREMYRILDQGIDGRTLMKLAESGRKLVQTEEGEGRLNHLVTHWDNAGIDPEMQRLSRQARSRKGRGVTVIEY